MLLLPSTVVVLRVWSIHWFFIVLLSTHTVVAVKWDERSVWRLGLTCALLG